MGCFSRRSRDRFFNGVVGDKEMTLAVDPAAMGLKGVTRLAISPKGDWIALVAQP